MFGSVGPNNITTGWLLLDLKCTGGFGSVGPNCMAMVGSSLPLGWMGGFGLINPNMLRSSHWWDGGSIVGIIRGKKMEVLEPLARPHMLGSSNCSMGAYGVCWGLSNYWNVKGCCGMCCGMCCVGNTGGKWGKELDRANTKLCAHIPYITYVIKSMQDGNGAWPTTTLALGREPSTLQPWSALMGLWQPLSKDARYSLLCTIFLFFSSKTLSLCLFVSIELVATLKWVEEGWNDDLINGSGLTIASVWP